MEWRAVMFVSSESGASSVRPAADGSARMELQPLGTAHLWSSGTSGATPTTGATATGMSSGNASVKSSTSVRRSKKPRSRAITTTASTSDGTRGEKAEKTLKGGGGGVSPLQKKEMRVESEQKPRI